MHDKDTEDLINQRIEDARGDIKILSEGKLPQLPGRYNKLERIRRAELLRRNPTFRLELAKATKSVDEEDLDKLCRSGDKAIWSVSGETKAWQDFCYRWGINDCWSGNLEGLCHYAWIDEAAIFYRKPGGATESRGLGSSNVKGRMKSFREARWASGVANEPAFVYLKIAPSLQPNDLKVFWPVIEQAKKEVWGLPRERAKDKFERDLCWWDLHNQFKISYGQIAKLWLKQVESYKLRTKNPTGQTPEESMRMLVREGIKRIDQGIKRLTPALESAPK